MNNNQGLVSCAVGCWLLAALAALLAAVLLKVLGSWSFVQTVFVGFLVLIVAGALLSWIMCKPLPPLGAVPQNRNGAPTAPQKISEPATEIAPEAPKPAPKPKTATAVPSASSGAKPEALSAPRDGEPDNLKMIKGVGPKLETLLHSMGFYHFDQISKWTDEEIAWVDENLKGFKGRVSRDGWVQQAKTLAEGGTTEFSKKVKKGDVY